MKKELVVKLNKQFDDYSHREGNIEYWYARELQTLLGYDRWENFINPLEKAKVACKNSRHEVADHFRETTKMVEIGSGTKRAIPDILLTRYACYLVAQNGNPQKDEIAFAQTYFAIQTRKQELIEQRLAEVERLKAREKLTQTEKKLSGIIYERGIDDKGFGRIRSKGDKALFGGRSTQDMKDKLNAPSKRALADFLPTITIKAKDFATEVTNVQVLQQNLNTEDAVTNEHVKNNVDVRKILTERNIYPENLPPAEDIKRVERKIKSEEKKALLGGKKKK